MDELIPTINKLQDVFNSLGYDPISLPQIVVVGSQSTGKSSVLENIVGRDFLPRGSDIVTRRPLVLQLLHLSSAPGSQSETPEWGEFLHKPEEMFSDFDQIRKEIENETARVAGTNKGVSRAPIRLRIYSPKVLNLTLVDLPGITKVPVGDQPTDIEVQIRNIVMEYISNENSIILAVTPANVDIANSESLKLAKEVDPAGKRTIGVLTKIDLMDQGTNAMDILTGKILPMRLGYVGVVNRSQMDINNKKSIDKSLKAEHDFFANHAAYKQIAHRCGTPYLAKNLNKILMNHIQEKLPELQRKIESNLAELQEQLNQYGSTFGEKVNPAGEVVQLLKDYATSFESSLDGKSENISTSALYGGAKINFVFTREFSRSIDRIDPCTALNSQEIQTAIQNSSGVRSALFIPEAAFENLVKREIEMLRAPSLHCLDSVHHELFKMAEDVCEKQLSRFPVLRTQVHRVVQEMLNERLSITKQMIDNLVNIELAFINTSHPDFLSAKTPSRSNDQNEKKSEEKKKSAQDSKRNQDSEQSSQNEKGLLYSWFYGRESERNDRDSNYNAQGKAKLTEKEEMEIDFIKSLIINYFKITKKSIQDLVPKSIMYFLVNHTKQQLGGRLIEELYKEEKFAEFLQEDQEVAAERMKVRAMIDVLKRSLTIIKTVS